MSGAQTDEQLKSLLVVQERLLQTREVRKSREALELSLSPEFEEVGFSGTVYNRESLMRMLLSSTGEPEVEASDFELKRLAPEVALLRYKSWQHGANGERQREAERTSVWVYAQSSWVMVFHQGTHAKGSGNAI